MNDKGRCNLKQKFFGIWRLGNKGKVLGCLLATALMFGVVHYPAAVSVAGTSRQLPIYCVQRDQKVLSISFDAAWGDARVRQIRKRIAANLIRRSYHKKRLVMEVAVP